MINKHFVQPKKIAKHQSGVVLVISLIMLLALTLIGVTSSSVTGLEERMSANTKDQNLAFQAAEAALQAAEDYLTIQPTFNRTATNANQGAGGLYTLLNNDGDPTLVPPLYPTLRNPPQVPPFYSQVDWYGTKVLTYGGATLANGKKLVGVSKQPVCIIEELSSAGSNTDDTSPCEMPCQRPASTKQVITFRITAHGWGSNNSVATVQSVVKVAY